jgi:eukaryotic-like serine/threonine-protein kinase
MTVSPGTRLGPYEILSRIGAGGMGEVWRARDTRLDRSVAIKVLPADLANNAELKLRFEREARSISQLAHPHICTLFDVGDERGTSYLVMELLDGETLSDRVAKGPLPLADVIRYGIQIADALDRAHQAGIVHRDLKPGNIMLTKSGAKLLDFGLAKAAVSAMAPDAATVQKELTQEGTIIGTFQYMAPEQLEGAEADPRTDIFALGAVLYEMTTGRRAFDGKTRTSLIAAIVAGEPAPMRSMQPLAPSALDHVVATCLEKDPEKRWQSARDVARELAWIGEGAGADTVASKPSRVWPFVAALLMILAIASGVLYVRERSKRVPPIAFSILPPPGLTFSAWPVIAPNGQWMAFATRDRGQESIWLRRVGEIAPVKLATVDRAAHFFWSPDSKWIGFFSGSALMRISVDGGQPETITKIDGYGVSGAWNKRGDILFVPKFGAGLFRVPASGGDAVAVTSLDAHARETLHGYAQFLGDDDRFLYLRRTIGEAPNEIYAGSLQGSLRKAVVKADALAGVWHGWLLFVRNGALYAQRFDEKKLTVSGEPRKIVDEADYSEEAATSSASVADDGAILYPPSSNVLVAHEYAWYDDTGKLQQKLFEEKGAGQMALSSDESKIARSIPDLRKGATDVHVRDVARGIDTRVTGGLSNNGNGVWSPDGERVYFASDREGMYDIYSQSDDGVSAAQPVWKGGDDKIPMDVSPDGTILLAMLYSPRTKNDIWIVPLVGGTPRPLIATDGSDIEATFSRDGKWILYQSDRSGRPECYVMAFPDGRSYQVSTEGGVGGEWNYDDSKVVFANGPTLYAADVKRNGKTAAVGKPAALFTMPKTMSGWWRSKTANRFLIRSIVDPRETVPVANYVKGWADALK